MHTFVRQYPLSIANKKHIGFYKSVMVNTLSAWHDGISSLYLTSSAQMPNHAHCLYRRNKTKDLNSPLVELEALVASSWFYSVDPQLSSSCSFFDEPRSDTLCTSTMHKTSNTTTITNNFLIQKRITTYLSPNRGFLHSIKNRGTDIPASFVIKHSAAKLFFQKLSPIFGTNSLEQPNKEHELLSTWLMCPQDQAITPRHFQYI